MSYRFNSTKLIIITVMFCIYIYPTGLFDYIFGDRYIISKLIFSIITFILFLFESRYIKKSGIIFISVIILFAVFSKNINFFVFITVVYLEKLLKHKNEIKKYIINSNILYVCLFATIIFSIIYAGINNRYAWSAISEINMSGLAIFFLGLLFLKKNKIIGISILLFGFLTFSRGYLLASIIIILLNIPLIKHQLKINLIKKLTYTKITFITSIALIGIAVFYINQYHTGNIVTSETVISRLYNLIDFSNFFRVQAPLIIIMCIIKNPIILIYGISDEKYISLGSAYMSEMRLPYRYIQPHNLFFSHLKEYGFFSILEIQYISNFLKRLVSIDNFCVFIVAAVYSVTLGAGLYSYWLYLTVFTMIVYE